MKTEQDEKGSYYTTMSALLLTAFTFEAYLNHLGDKTIKFWEEIEPINPCLTLFQQNLGFL
ncbi:hypothetical protein HF929_15215 [Acidithiobacillus ferrivorans]|nr:hypothetical protein [Acidithiobacillus ferrivorans]